MDIKHATFKGGIHPPYHKDLTNTLPIEVMPAPKEVVIPMSMHIGAPANPEVEKGQEVKMGQLIGQAGGFVSANVYSSVSGKVKAIEMRPTMNGQKTKCVVIENDFQDTLADDIVQRNYEDLSAKDLLGIVGEAGIVGLGGATFPTRVKLSPPPGNEIKYVIINGAECEPYLSSDHAVMRDHAEEVIKGLKICMKILGLNKGYIGIEDNKQDAIEALSKAADDSIEIYSLGTKYPQGSEKHLITAVTGQEVPSGALPAAVGCIIVNAGTVYAIYNAVANGMPLFERVVTVTGSGINTPKVLRFRIGTSIQEIIDYCGGLTDDIAKVILGGPMMGFAQYQLDIPATKGTSGILCLNQKDAFIQEPSACIRCCKCVDACPMHLMPLYIAGFSTKGNFEKCEEYNALDCIECGSCAFVCPARRPLVSSIRVAKRTIIANRKKKG